MENKKNMENNLEKEMQVKQEKRVRYMTNAVYISGAISISIAILITIFIPEKREFILLLASTPMIAFLVTGSITSDSEKYIIIKKEEIRSFESGKGSFVLVQKDSNYICYRKTENGGFTEIEMPVEGTEIYFLEDEEKPYLEIKSEKQEEVVGLNNRILWRRLYIPKDSVIERKESKPKKIWER